MLRYGQTIFVFLGVVCQNMSAFIMLIQQALRSAEVCLKGSLPDAKGIATMSLLEVFTYVLEHCESTVKKK